jgi:hypothetical protein
VEITTVDGIPTTTVARTLLDLAAVVPAHHLRRAVERAVELELFDLTAISEVLDAHPRRPGRPALLTLVADLKDHGTARTRSDVEAPSCSPASTRTCRARWSTTTTTAASATSRSPTSG